MRLVGAIRIMLGFEADGCALWIDDSVLTFHGAIQEIACVKLDARFVGINFEGDAGSRAGQLGCYLADVALGIQYPVVVEAFTELD